MPSRRPLVHALPLAAILALAPVTRTIGAQAPAPAGAMRRAGAIAVPLPASTTAGDTSRAAGFATVNLARATGAVLGSAGGVLVLLGTSYVCDGGGNDACIGAGIMAGSVVTGFLVSEVTASAGVPRARRATIIGAVAGAVLVNAGYLATRRQYREEQAMIFVALSPLVPIGAVIGNVVGQELARNGP